MTNAPSWGRQRYELRVRAYVSDSISFLFTLGAPTYRVEAASQDYLFDFGRHELRHVLHEPAVIAGSQQGLKKMEGSPASYCAVMVRVWVPASCTNLSARMLP